MLPLLDQVGPAAQAIDRVIAVHGERWGLA
jgi:hypothetical protein